MKTSLLTLALVLSVFTAFSQTEISGTVRKHQGILLWVSTSL